MGGVNAALDPEFEDGRPSDLGRGRKSERKHENNPSPARVASPWVTATLAQHRVADGRADCGRPAAPASLAPRR
jgi:hypothetical protein